MVTSKHDTSVSSSDGTANGIRKLLIGSANSAREGHVHEGVILLRMMEAEVAKVVHRVF